MSDYPTEPLILIDKGSYQGVNIDGTTATLVDIDDPKSGYYLIDGPKIGDSINEDNIPESITARRPCAAVPIGELESLRQAFMGVELNRLQHAIIQKLITHTTKEPVNEHG